MFDRAIELTRSDLPNYVVSSAASGVCALATFASSMEGCGTSYYLNLLATLTLAGAAVNQYGLDKSRALASTLARNGYHMASNGYNRFFGHATDTAKKRDDVETRESMRP